MAGMVLTSPEDVVNAALKQIGVVDRVSDLQGGRALEKAALDIYGQSRDQLLREGNWSFSVRNATLAVLKSAPSNYAVATWSSASPPPPWRYSYTYPSDCLKVRAIKSVPIFLPDYAPQPNLFDVQNDNSYSPARKVILGNLASGVVIFTGQVVDVSTWEPLFAETLIAVLAKRMAPGFAKSGQAQLATEKEEAQQEARETVIALSVQG